MTQPMLAASAGVGWAFERYERIRSRLPSARFAHAPRGCGSLAELAARFDAFLFDSFGVLNVGDRAIPGAADCVARLRSEGKQVLVLTNAATSSLASLPEKYRALGFDFASEEIVSSRQVLARHLAAPDYAGFRWAVIAPQSARAEELPIDFVAFAAEPAAADDADGFILLSSAGWTEEQGLRLAQILNARPRPVLVGNPDLVAPREYGLSLEPGSIAHDLLDALPGLDVRFFGKPYANAFDEALRRLPEGIERGRVAMVGDTLHTDVLGAAAGGLGTVLVTGWGVLKGADAGLAIARSGIVPDHIVPSI